MAAPPVPARLELLRVKSDRRLIRTVLLVGVIPIAFFTAYDLLGYAPNDHGLTSRALARVMSLALPALGLWLTRGRHTPQSLSRAVFAITLVAVPVVVILELQQSSGSTLVIPSLLLLLVIMYGALPNTFVRQVLPPLLLSVLVAGPYLWRLDGTSEQHLAADLLVVMTVNVIGILTVQRRLALQDQVSESWRQEAEALERERTARQLADQALHQLKTLHGIIPICASCKQVRTDAGEWQAIERYVHEHSDAQFSHGVCPSCAKQLYADYLTDEFDGRAPDPPGITT